MVGLGFIMLFEVIVGTILYIRGSLFTSNWYLKLCLLNAPIGFVSIITGWFTAELGRQPWVIYHYLRTTDAHSKLKLENIIISLVSIVIVYGIIFGFFYFRYLFRIINKGPELHRIKREDETFFYLAPNSEEKN